MKFTKNSYKSRFKPPPTDMRMSANVQKIAVFVVTLEINTIFKHVGRAPTAADSWSTFSRNAGIPLEMRGAANIGR